MKQRKISYKLSILMMVATFLMLTYIPVLAQAPTDSVVWPMVKVTGEESWSDLAIGNSIGNVTAADVVVFQAGNPEGVNVASGDGTYLRRRGSWGIGGNVGPADPDSGRRMMRISWQEGVVYPGESSPGFPTYNTDIIQNVYWQFQVTPKNGYKFDVSSISMHVGQSNDEPGRVKAFVSTDPDFLSDITEVYDGTGDTLPVWDFNYLNNIPVDVSVDPGESLYMRIYPWVHDAAVPEDDGRFLLKRVSIKGTTELDPSATKIIWMSEEIGGLEVDSAFVELLEDSGYVVQKEVGTLQGTLDDAAKATLNDADLVIMSRTVNSGRYNDATGWNSLTVPVLQISPYLVRASRWQWFNNSSLLPMGGAPMYEAEDAGHAIFNGVTLDMNDQVQALDPNAGIGNTVFWIQEGDVGADAEVLATRPDSGWATIVYWPEGASFHDETLQNASGPRMFFTAAAREGTRYDTTSTSPLVIDTVTAAQGEYNLTDEGATMFVNAARFMIEEGPGMEPIAPDLKISWVTDKVDPQDDIEWVEKLRAEGYSVTLDTSTMQGTLTEDQKDALNSQDVVIVSRRCGSGSYNDPTGWNSLTVPVILQSPYLVRNSRWDWIDNADIIKFGGSSEYKLAGEHPIFDGVTVSLGNAAILAPDSGNGNAVFLGTDEVGPDAQVLATNADSGWVSIVYWPTGASFYNETLQNASGHRLYFVSGTREGEVIDSSVTPWDTLNAGQGEYNLTDDGWLAFTNAIEWLAEEGPGEGAIEPDKVINWVNSDNADSVWVEMLEEEGYKVDVHMASMQGTLTDSMKTELEDGDLIVFSRANGSGSYNDADGWNSLDKPLILHSVYLSRMNRWQWFSTSDYSGDTPNGICAAENPNHPIFDGVELALDKYVVALDSTIGTGMTPWANVQELAGNQGEIIARQAGSNDVQIVFWEANDQTFNDSTTQKPYGHRLLFTAGMREGTVIEGTDTSEYQWGEYNLTEEGKMMFLNSIEWMCSLGDPTTDIESIDNMNPKEFELFANYPNPFNPSTTIRFMVPHRAEISLKVFNVLGQEIVELTNQEYLPGTHTLQWNGKNNSGTRVASGFYIYQLKTEDVVKSRKMLLLK